MRRRTGTSLARKIVKKKEDKCCQQNIDAQKKTKGIYAFGKPIKNKAEKGKDGRA